MPYVIIIHGLAMFLNLYPFQRGDSMIATLTRFQETFMGRFRFSDKLSALYYNRILDKEIALGNVRPGDRVLFIGGGSMPYSAYYLNQKTSAAVDVLDHDASVITSARAYLENRQARDVHVYCGAFDSLNIGQYDHIFLAKQLIGKHRMINQLNQRKADHARLVVRASLKESLPECDFKAYVKFGFVRTLWLY